MPHASCFLLAHVERSPYRAAMVEPKRGRPTSPEAKRHPVMVRMDDAEKNGLDRLVSSRNEELKAEHITLKGPDVIRWLIARELSARGLDKVPAEVAAPPAPKKKARAK